MPTEINENYRKAVEAWLRDELKGVNDDQYIQKVCATKLSGNSTGEARVKSFTPVLDAFGVRWSDSAVLDIGCGLGGFLVAAAKKGARYCEGWEVAGGQDRTGQAESDVARPKPECGRLSEIDR